jgi:signal transduction histidine kinase
MAQTFWDRIALEPQRLDPRVRSTIRRSFFAYAASLLVVGWALAIWFIVGDRQRTIEGAGNQLRTVATSLNSQLDAMLGAGLGSAESVLNDFRKAGGLATASADEIGAKLSDQVTGNYIRALFLGDQRRTVVAGSTFVEQYEGVPYWLSPQPGPRQTTVVSPMQDPTRKTHRVIAVVRGAGDAEGWLGIWLDVEELLDRFGMLGIEGGQISMIRADGWLLTGTSSLGRPAPPVTDLGGTDVFERIRTLPADAAYVLEGVSAIDGKRKLFAVAKAGDGVPLDLAVTQEYDTILAPWRRSAMMVLWLSLGTSAVLIVMTALLYRFMEEINRRETQFHKLFENSLASILLFKQGVIVEHNSQALQTFRIPPDGTLHGLRVPDISPEVQPNGMNTPEAVVYYEEMLRREGGATFQWLFKRVDTGEPFEGEVNLSTIPIAGDAVMLAIVRVISEQEAARRALRDLNVELEMRVARRTAQLQQANAQLAATNRALEEFAASASHDLRSPLSTISGQAGLLELSASDRFDAKEKERLLRIQTAVARASVVVEGLLSLARITRQELQTEAVDLSQVARSAVEALREADPLRPVEVHIEPNMIVLADRGLMTSLVDNLINNAWKYSAKRAQVWIRFDRRRRGDKIVYCIADRGAGFDMQYAERLFQAFRRLHSPEEFEGSGIGLATVARIVHRYGGEIWAEAELDVGASFYFTLPNAELSSEGESRRGVAPQA